MQQGASGPGLNIEIRYSECTTSTTSYRYRVTESVPNFSTTLTRLSRTSIDSEKKRKWSQACGALLAYCSFSLVTLGAVASLVIFLVSVTCMLAVGRVLGVYMFHFQGSCFSLQRKMTVSVYLLVHENSLTENRIVSASGTKPQLRPSWLALTRRS